MYSIENFTSDIAVCVGRWPRYPSKGAELESIANTLAIDQIVHDLTIRTPMGPLRVNPFQTPFTNDINLIVNRGKAGNLTGPQMAAALTGATPVPQAPVCISPPVISGPATVGSVLTCDTGVWLGSPTIFEFIWTRNEVPIGGATGQTYTIVAADGGTTLECEVKAVNALGAGQEGSNEIAVPPVAPLVSVKPVISGNPTVAWRLSCTAGTWINSPTSFAYQWLNDGAAIPNAIGTDHILTDEDANSTVACQVTATNAYGNGAALSNTMQVVQGPPVNFHPPIAALNPTYVLCTGGQWTGGAMVYNYQWIADGVPVGGATNSTWSFAGYEGQTVVCAVTVQNQYGVCPAINTNSVVIPQAGTPQPLEAPGISGTPTVGSTLSCIEGTWSNSPTSFAYQWLRNGVAIDGATWGDGTYLVVAADDETYLSCQVIASNAAGAGPSIVTNSVLIEGTDT